MTSEQTSVDDTPSTPPPGASRQSPGDAALARYQRRMRPLRIAYAVGIVVVVAVALVIVKIAYGKGEISHVTLRTVADPPAAVASADPASDLGRTWSSEDTTAIGIPYAGGTVVTHDEHTVRGRNARTGAQTWSYTRTDRTVCAAMQSPYDYQGKGYLTVAVYRLHGDCDEVTALDSQTGERKWTRTLFEDTAIFSGPASFFVAPGNLSGQNAYFYFVSRTSIYEIDSTGYFGWTFHHVGCTINSAVGGTSGVLISQTCKGQDCQSHKFCGNGTQLLLRDGTAGYDDSNNNDNPDQIKWNSIGSDLVPTSAGRTLSARDPDGATLHLLSDDKGRRTGQLALSGSPAAGDQAQVQTFSDADLIWLAGRTYALDDAATRFSWTAATASLPVPSDIAAAQQQPVAAASVAVPTATGVAFLDAATGKEKAGYATGASPAGTLAFRYGAGFVMAGPHTSVLS